MTDMLPAGACDCHVHLFGPAERYPFDPVRVYTPKDASEADLTAMHRRHGIARVVLVQPSVYGTDNRRLVDGLSTLGCRARGIAVITGDENDAALDCLAASGVRGVRVNLSTAGRNDPAEAWQFIEAQARRVAPLGWHVQVLTKAPVIAALADRIAGLPCPLVIDHFGQPDLVQTPDQPAFRAILELVRDGHAIVKLSAMERLVGKGGIGHLAPFVMALAAANPRGIVWGSDWPHTGGGRGLGPATARSPKDIEPFQDIDDGDAIAALSVMLSEAALRHAVFVSNPARLYGFSEEVTP